MFNLALILILFTLFFLFLPLLTSFKSYLGREAMTPFECGFDPYHTSRIPFSLQFFLITVIFLIFDIEIAILLPLPLTQNMNLPLIYNFTIFVFFLILLLGTYYEWYKGALNWNY